MKKTVMIIGAAVEHCLGIQAAHALGLKVFVTDGNPGSPGFVLADGYSVASTYDPEGTLQAAREYIARGERVDGVMTLAADVPYTVAHVAHGLGLPNIGLESALNASEKVRMKRCFRNGEVPIPFFREVFEEEHLQKVAQDFGLPLVVKPVDSRGGRGVQLVKKSAYLSRAYKIALSYSPSNRVMVEQYLPGPQLSTEGFMVGGKAYIPAIFDRNYEFMEAFAPFIVENGGGMPSIYDRKYREEIWEVMERAALALGIREGVIKGDLVIHEGRVKVIEIAARLSGGFFGTVATPVSCGVDLLRFNIRLCLGERVAPRDLEHKFEKAAAIRFAFPRPGRVKGIAGLDQICRDPSCRFMHVFVKEGELLDSITNHPGRPAVVVAEGEELDAAVSNARRLVGKIHWEIEDV
jgi:biotin carboxylase